MISRRKFFQRSLQATGTSLLLASLEGCQPSGAAYSGSLQGPDAKLGHMLRTMKFEPPRETIKIPIVIVGGGASGLSAARYLRKFTSDFMLLELGHEPGGNALGGKNQVSAYPWGAHYLPIPDAHDTELLDFLQEAKVITGYENGLPVYNEYYLCFDPKERLYIHNYWQEGLVPREGVPGHDRGQIERFLTMMNAYKERRGNDGRDAFAIPVEMSSRDPKLLALDQISMDEFLQQNNFSSTYLKWYVAYCCADDYGTTLADTSAWAGIHYFCARKGKAANAAHDTVLTWPEGNQWLIQQLQQPLQSNIRTQCLVYAVESKSNHVEVLFFDAASGATRRIIAQAAILATPQFVNQRLLPTHIRPLRYEAFEYSPWMVANVTVKDDLSQRHGESLCWDNVIYGSDALGYVNATHQRIHQGAGEHVITYYKPLVGHDAKATRRDAYQRTHDYWKDMVLRDLKQPHPAIEKRIQELNTWVWGHGMIRPSPGFIWGPDRDAARKPLNDQIYFAHSDLSGVSIFEEAFYRGHTAAQLALQHL
jgi:predicted NAD/FAD-binding protein